MSIDFVGLPLDIPSQALSASVASWPEACLLESAQGFGASNRWSILASEPRLVFEMTGEAWTLRQGSNVREGKGGGLDQLGLLLKEFDLANPNDRQDAKLPHFQGGMIGFLGYDLAPRLERLPRRAPKDLRLPDLRFGLYDTAIVVDHELDSATLFAFDLLGEGRPALLERIDRWKKRLDRPVRPPVRPSLKPLRSRFTPESYQNTIKEALEYIAAGDIFQVNLSQRFETTASGELDPAWIHARLRSRSPAPFSSMLRWDDLAVISASPELFYRTEGTTIITRPIKGTRPRGKSPELDEKFRLELSESKKDRAELTMIVDLERNDLGRVCEYGSIRVADSLKVETFAQVHHLVATIEGRLRPEVGPIDVVKAVFPGGSITGAPKIRAMEIIDELEPNRRNLYTGAIGYFGRGGTSQFNIAIRTVLVEGNRLSFQVGGGIVADSSPSAEYQETLDKAEGIRLALDPQPDGQI